MEETRNIILPQNRTGSARKINPIKTLSEHGQQLKKKVFSGFQGQSIVLTLLCTIILINLIDNQVCLILMINHKDLDISLILSVSRIHLLRRCCLDVDYT